MRGFCPSNLQELRMKLSSTVGELRRRSDVLASFHAASSPPPIGDD
jgi:hypothetical protein